VEFWRKISSRKGSRVRAVCLSMSLQLSGCRQARRRVEPSPNDLDRCHHG
jgi:hypothetical protein